MFQYSSLNIYSDSKFGVVRPASLTADSVGLEDNIVESYTLKKYSIAIMPTSTLDRDSLTSRALPEMILSTGDTSSMTGPPAPMPHYLTSDGRAIKRFEIEGNAISMSSFSRVLSCITTSLLYFSVHPASRKLI